MLFGLAVTSVSAGDLSTREANRLPEAATVLKEIHGAPDKDIPQELWPIFMQIGRGSWGLQIGAQSIDLVLLVMNANGMEKILRNKVSLGADASIAAGPVGRDARAATDTQMKAEICVVRADADDNVDLYGKSIAPNDVVMGGTVKAPAATDAFLATLMRSK